MARAAKAQEQLRKQKERKQKRLLLFVLLPVLAVALAIQGPKLKELFSSTKEKTEGVQGQVVQGFEELAPTTPVETAPGASPSDPTAAAISATAGFSDTDAPPETDEGQLISFTRFDAQDPFVQLVSDESADQGTAPADAASVSEPSTTVTTDTAPAPTVTPSEPPDDTATTGAQASISVNGSVVVVAVGETFPENDPAFEVVAIEGNIVKIGLAGGSFSNGVDTIDLRVGDTVTLISQPDGARFQLKVVKVS